MSLGQWTTLESFHFMFPRIEFFARTPIEERDAKKTRDDNEVRNRWDWSDRWLHSQTRRQNRRQFVVSIV
jgi:hypothetical protein